jgi:hypothetical protein
VARGITSKKPTKTKPTRDPPTALYSIKSFCSAHNLSEGFFHKLCKQGLAPDVMKLGTRIFITHESAARWRAEREAATVAAE